MQKFSHFIAIAILSISASTPVFAQNMNGDGARVEKIERDLMLLQRQISRSGGGSASGGAAPSGSAELEVRLSAIEEQLREMSGKAEENEFKIRKLTENLDKLQRDTDFRFGELTHAPAAQPTPANTLAPVSGPRKIPDENLKAEVDKNVRSLGKTVDTVPPPSAANVPDSSPVDDVLETEFANSRDHYNYAFRLLNQTQYDKASESFATFIKKYPKDPLVGNAYYWQGETFYIRRDYVKAADSFRQGFEELPTGPKAPDNLLKLAMTLNALKRDKEACVVLGQVVSKFKTTSAAVSQKADQERKRIDCK